MIAILIAVMLSLVTVQALGPWGLATFGLFGWYALCPLIGAPIGVTVVAAQIGIQRLRYGR